MRLATAVRRALRDVDTAAVDVGAVELALTYAREYDRAELVRASLLRVLREVEQLDVDVHDRLVPLAVQVERVHVLAALGPKLLAALEALGMTPRARAAVVRGAGGDGTDIGTPLDQLRERRRARQHDAAPVDPAAP